MPNCEVRTWRTFSYWFYLYINHLLVNYFYYYSYYSCVSRSNARLERVLRRAGRELACSCENGELACDRGVPQRERRHHRDVHCTSRQGLGRERRCQVLYYTSYRLICRTTQSRDPNEVMIMKQSDEFLLYCIIIRAYSTFINLYRYTTCILSCDFV